MSGRVFAVVGPSGVGKDTLLSGVCARPGGPCWARRVITRPSQAGGEPFEGVSEAEFAARLAAGEFLLHWDAHGLRYGIPAREFAPLEEGRDVLFNGSRAALAEAARVFPGLTVLRITAPLALRAERLAVRGRESAAEIAARLEREVNSLPEGLDVIELVNDARPEDGIARLAAALQRSVAR